MGVGNQLLELPEEEEILEDDWQPEDHNGRPAYYTMQDGELVETTRQEFEAVIYDIKYYGQRKEGNDGLQ